MPRGRILDRSHPAGAEVGVGRLAGYGNEGLADGGRQDAGLDGFPPARAVSLSFVRAGSEQEGKPCKSRQYPPGIVGAALHGGKHSLPPRPPGWSVRTAGNPAWSTANRVAFFLR
jgi:hypothetical protein